MTKEKLVENLKQLAERSRADAVRFQRSNQMLAQKYGGMAEAYEVAASLADQLKVRTVKSSASVVSEKGKDKEGK